MCIYLHLQHHFMPLPLLLERNHLSLEHPEQLLEDEAVLMLNYVSDGLGSQRVFVAFDHVDQSFHLFLVLLPYFLVGLDLELQALGLIDPVYPLSPSRVVVQLLKDLLKFSFGGSHILLLRVDDQIVVLSEDGDECSFLLLHAPGQLLKEGEELVLINGIPFCQTAHVHDRMEDDVIRLKFLQNFLADDCSIVQFIQSRDVEYPESYLLSCYLKGSALVVVDFSGDFFETIGDLDGWIAGEQLGGCTFARP